MNISNCCTELYNYLMFYLNHNVAVDCGQPESPDPNGAVSVGETTLRKHCYLFM